MSVFRIMHQTGSGAVAINHIHAQAYRVAEIRLHLGGTVTDLKNLLAKIDSEHGAAYDFLVAKPDSYSADLTAITDWRYADLVPPIVFPGDRLKVDWPNTGNVTWSIEIIGCE